MLESIHPYELKYIQKEKPKSRDAFDFCLVYSFLQKLIQKELSISLGLNFMRM